MASPARIGHFRGTRPLCAADLRTIVRNLDRYGYPDECPVEIVTPLPPRDRRVVDIKVHDYTTTIEGDPE